MANSKGKGHQLEPHVVKRLLDRLTSDDDFRSRFETDAQAALESIGYVPPTEFEAAVSNMKPADRPVLNL